MLMKRRNRKRSSKAASPSTIPSDVEKPSPPKIPTSTERLSPNRTEIAHSLPVIQSNELSRTALVGTTTFGDVFLGWANAGASPSQ